MAGLDFFSLVCACLCSQRLLHGRDRESPGPGRSCPLALVLQTHWGRLGSRAVVLALPRPCSRVLVMPGRCCTGGGAVSRLNHPAPLLAAFLLQARSLKLEITKDNCPN